MRIITWNVDTHARTHAMSFAHAHGLDKAVLERKDCGNNFYWSAGIENFRYVVVFTARFDVPGDGSIGQSSHKKNLCKNRKRCAPCDCFWLVDTVSSRCAEKQEAFSEGYDRPSEMPSPMQQLHYPAEKKKTPRQDEKKAGEQEDAAIFFACSYRCY